MRHKKNLNSGLRLASLCAAILGYSSSVLAAEEAQETRLEEIVVTAQKIEQSLLDTPIAVTAFTRNALQKKGIDDISEIAEFTPNLVFDTTSPVSGLSSGAIVFIRGVGNTDFSLTTDPGVGTYVDGVYVSRSAGGVLDVLDVERIEVLRGPQGTLFGRNTIGGAINITSRKPADELQANLEATFGNFSRQDFRAAVDVPFADNFRATFAASSKQRDGFVRRVNVGDRLGDEDKLAFRANFVFEPSDELDFSLSYDNTKINEQSAGSTLVAFTPGAGTVGFSLATQPDIPTGLGFLNQFPTDGEDDISFATGETGTVLDIQGIAFNANYHGPSYDVKYTFAYRETEGEFFRDPDNTPFAITETLNTNYDQDQTSHELQITGTAFDSKFTYAAGLYYFEEDGTDDVFVNVFLPAPDLSFGFPATINNFATVENTSEAAYFQGSWSVTPSLALSAGVRYTRDEKRFDFSQFIAADAEGNPLPLPPPAPAAVNQDGVLVSGLIPLVGNGSGDASDSFKETTLKFGADYNLNDDTLLYYSFSQGFKSGGFVLRYVAAVPEPLTFEPETIDTHEIGVKWEGLDGRVRVNAAAYVSDYEDVQVTFFDVLGGPVTANAGTVDIKGFELELNALITSNLLLDLGYGFNDAEYEQINQVPGLSLTIDDSASLVNTPENTFNIGLQYSIPFGANEVALRADYAFTDDIFNDAQNSPFLFQESYSVLNARVTVSIGESIDVSFFGDNLTDERYIESGDSNFGLGFHEANFNRPREYGATLRYRFQ